jgi:CubicO group peptidase (beta-lactamase class C family)
MTRSTAMEHGRRSLLALAAALAACVTPPPAPGRAAPSPVVPADSTAALERMADIARLRDTVRDVLEQAVADSAFPGAVAVIGSRDGILASYGVGVLDRTIPVRPDEATLWDLASLTKVVALTSAMIVLVDEGRIDLDAPVQRYLPEWTGEGKERVTVRHLLTHSSGLPAWRPLYKEAVGPAEAAALVLATPLDTVPGARMVYSDLGIVLAGKIVERITGKPLDVFVRERVFEPLGMTSTMYRPDSSLIARIAPTEFDPWRQRQPRGEVHDENAFALGGVAGHAGLFSTARDLSRFARMYLTGGTLDGVRFARPETLARFTMRQDPALSHRAIGWETPTGSNSAGHLLSASAFGHTGFTGTSIWIDPERDLFVVLLTNRVNPTRQNLRISRVRVALADAVAPLFAPRPGASPPSAPSSSGP